MSIPNFITPNQRIALHNVDCMAAMAQLPDKFFDLAICDPQYGMGASSPTKKMNTAVQSNGTILPVAHHSYTKKDWDNERMPNWYFDELRRVSKRQIVWGGNYYGLQGGYLVWDKLNGESDQMGAEMAHLSFTDRVDMVYFMWHGMMQGVYCGKDVKKALVQQGNKSLNEKRIHPTQKPAILYKWLLSNYAKEGDKILDTHLGSGSIALACYDLKFSLTGFEIDSEYFAAMEQRLKNHIAQGVLF